jgi:hypothetical protein
MLLPNNESQTPSRFFHLGGVTKKRLICNPSYVCRKYKSSLKSLDHCSKIKREKDERRVTPKQLLKAC